MFSKQNGNRFHRLCIILFLLTAIFAVYWQTVGHEFISYDDPEYITDNPAIKQGLTLSAIVWAFTTFHASNWHPLTWLSHLLDVELFGMNPAGHHLVNIILHSANSILLFLLLNRYSRFFWRSAVVAALFALHPLHVESVAWVAERKDLLSALFWMLTLYLYADYVEKAGTGRYLLLLTTFTLGLMAKPMLVTLPLVMILLDYWPLRRLDSADISVCPTSKFMNLIKEKIPFLLLVAASSTVTIFAQQAALSSLSATTITARISNALSAYLAYLGKALLPQNLAVFYQFNYELPWEHVLGATTLLCAISIMAVRMRQVRPYLFVGWLWYLITLVPVIGIVQVGMQSMADRYTYIPLIGIFIIIVWAVADVAEKWRYRQAALTILTATVVTACAITSWQQVSHWRTSTTLFSHAIASTEKNFIAHFRLGNEFEQLGRAEEAAASYKAALADNPFYGAAYGKLAKISYESGRLEEAIRYYYKELFMNPLSVYSRNNLGIALAENGQLDEAIRQFSHALTLEPDFEPAQDNLKRALDFKNGTAKKPYR